MSTETQKKHEFTGVPALTVVYLRNALNNPSWASGLQDWVDGCDALRTIPRVFIPKGMTDDLEIFTWAVKNLESFQLSDTERDICRKALTKAFEIKALPINEYAVRLITLFSLKS